MEEGEGKPGGEGGVKTRVLKSFYILLILFIINMAKVDLLPYMISWPYQ